MNPLGIIFLISVSTCAFLKTNEALNEAQTLQEVIWSLRQPDEIDQLFDSASEFDETDKIVTLSAKAQRALRKADKIESLPGQPKGVNFAQYAGYINVNKQAGRELFYYLAESPTNSSTKPLVLWLNGGPGCSSLGYGAMEEVGPFRVNADGKTLSRFKYAWNNLANMLFVESPAGVGYSRAKPNHINGDVQTAKENYIFLLNWLERFPQYKKRPFFMTGESYAGHYIPQLADLILTKNQLKPTTFINLQAVAIGNAYVDKLQNRRDQDEYLWHRDFITDEGFAEVKKNCEEFYSNENFTIPCLAARMKTFYGEVDNYNIYAPLCLKNKDGSPKKSDETEQGIDPCIDDFVERYLNLPEVKKAFHADQNVNWVTCNHNLTYTLRDNTTVPIIKKIVTKGLRVILYSGDTDSVVPITTTKKSVKDMQLPVKKPWRPWNCDNQVGGFVEEYENLWLATVRGAGHMVPSNQPLRAYSLFHHFIAGKPLPIAPLIPSDMSKLQI
ncbi:hypothetical protein LUZ61_008703 [Rhynchospora tenuis]|uniref:Carboxypeptidase n=1 Tax=Rhynchospora tenuis TaxID=198213 RepID=A0AAD6EXQ4_9POAL|nr:hypothetical protein LUZ61_008703 [Rhynchospora tenuis]